MHMGKGEEVKESVERNRREGRESKRMGKHRKNARICEEIRKRGLHTVKSLYKVTCYSITPSTTTHMLGTVSMVSAGCCSETSGGVVKRFDCTLFTLNSLAENSQRNLVQSWKQEEVGHKRHKEQDEPNVHAQPSGCEERAASENGVHTAQYVSHCMYRGASYNKLPQ